MTFRALHRWALSGAVGLALGVLGCSHKPPPPPPGTPAVDSSKPPPDMMDLQNRSGAKPAPPNGR